MSPRDKTADREAFERGMQGVTPLPAGVSRAVPQKRRAATPNSAAQDGPAPEFLSDEDGGPRGYYAKDAGKGPLRKLRGARARTHPTVDLHHHTADRAKLRLVDAVDAALAAGHPILHVIHGRGTGSLGGAVLPDVVKNILMHSRVAPYVAAFVLALPRDGGDGATLVGLRRLRRRDRA